MERIIMDNEYYTLITGASRGIGRAMACEMAMRGHNLALHSLPGEQLNQVAGELEETYGIKISTFEIDLTETDGPLRLYNEFIDRGLKINILINNAGIGMEGPLESFSHRDIDNMIFLNVRALTLLTFFFTPELKKTKSFILNISSFGCYVATPYKSVYLASKTYIYYFTRALEAEFKGSSVKTCVFVPGGVRTSTMVLKRMEKAGWMSKSTSLSPEEVAFKGIRAMFRGKNVWMPGKLTRFIFSMCLFVPEGIILAITRNIFRREYSI
jgi:short-subunit dehydrogenase